MGESCVRPDRALLARPSPAYAKSFGGPYANGWIRTLGPPATASFAVGPMAETPFQAARGAAPWRHHSKTRRHHPPAGGHNLTLPRRGVQRDLPQSCRDSSEIASFRAAELQVRIHLPRVVSRANSGTANRELAIKDRLRLVLVSLNAAPDEPVILLWHKATVPELNVRDDNPAQRLYERIGFRLVLGSGVPNRVGGTSYGMIWTALRSG